MTEQEMLTQIYKIFIPSLPRLGPGDPNSTQKALAYLPDEIHRKDCRILDLGCGNGAQTLCLARHLAGGITALDTHQPFLDELMRRAGEEGLSDRIRPLCQDMASFATDGVPYDLIWCEGAIYHMGFSAGIRHCRALLGANGFLALTDLNWLGADRPQPCRDFFDRIKLPVLDIDGNLALVREVGFEVLGHFVLPPSAWWTDYYSPLTARLNDLKETHAQDALLMETLAEVEYEIDLFRLYPQTYGYVFYVLKA